MRHLENGSSTLAKVVRGFSRRGAAVTRGVESGGRCVFTERASVLFAGGVTARAADYFRKRECVADSLAKVVRGFNRRGAAVTRGVESVERCVFTTAVSPTKSWTAFAKYRVAHPSFKMPQNVYRSSYRTLRKI